MTNIYLEYQNLSKEEKKVIYLEYQNLSKEEKKIIHAINLEGETKFEEIQIKTRLSQDELFSALDDLVKKKFIEEAKFN